MGAIIEKTKAAIEKVDQWGDFARSIFTEFDRNRILDEAEAAEKRVSTNPKLPLAGMLVSIKDLYDEAGITTTAASRLLQNRAPAIRDCEVVRRVKEAGAVPFGRTTLSEFAYSSVGLNPHYGTPGNIFDSERIPGGSTSGGALTVAYGLVDFALGTDTGGSIRIPAAINGIYGFKPSRLSVPGQGIHPLARSFDTPGPLAANLATVATAFAVISGQNVATADHASRKFRIGVPLDVFSNDTDDRVSQDFAMICEVLRGSEHQLIEVNLGFISEQSIINKKLVAAEAHKIYSRHFTELEQCGDPHILSRMRFGDTLSAEDLIEAYAKRTDLVSQFGSAMADVDFMIAPTLPVMAPEIAAVEADFDHFNAMMLRNTALLNLVDACAISIPVPVPGQIVPAALMLAAPHGHDPVVLAAAQAMDLLLRGSGR